MRSMENQYLILYGEKLFLVEHWPSKQNKRARKTMKPMMNDKIQIVQATNSNLANQQNWRRITTYIIILHKRLSNRLNIYSKYQILLHDWYRPT